jgi:hypothetical protein
MSTPTTKKTPWGIGGHEHVAGFFVAKMPGDYVALAGSKAALNEGPGAAGAETCYQVPQRIMTPPDEPPASEWGQAQAVMNLPSSAEMGGGNAVATLHAERIVGVDATHASLEWSDAWVDPATRGARLVAKGAMPLVVARELPGGGQVLLGRDADHLHVIVVQSATKKQAFSSRDQLMAVGPNGMTGVSGCRHLRASLHVDKGTADNVVVFTAAQLPALPDATQRPGQPPPGGPMVRVRPMTVSASVSWMARDSEPVVALAVGWRAREEQVRAMASAGF